MGIPSKGFFGTVFHWLEKKKKKRWLACTLGFQVRPWACGSVVNTSYRNRKLFHWGGEWELPVAKKNWSRQRKYFTQADLDVKSFLSIRFRRWKMALKGSPVWYLAFELPYTSTISYARVMAKTRNSYLYRLIRIPHETRDHIIEIYYS